MSERSLDELEAERDRLRRRVRQDRVESARVQKDTRRRERLTAEINGMRRRLGEDLSDDDSERRQGMGVPRVSPRAERAAQFILSAGGREPRPNDGEKGTRLRQRRDALEEEAREAVELFERASNG